MTRLLLIAGLTALGAALAPGVASAAVTTTVAGKTLTVTSDERPDSITLSAEGGFIKVNATVTTLAASPDAEIMIFAGDGGDIVDASRLPADGYGTLGADGGEGDDLLIGGPGSDSLYGRRGADDLEGRAGDDFVIGDAGDDTMLGEAGNDAMAGGAGRDTARGGDGDDGYAWNDGNGSAVIEGGDGDDIVFVNGAREGDVFTLSAGTTGPRIRRTNLVPFELDLETTESIDVLGDGGDDELTVSPGLHGIAVTALGREGSDTLTGAGEADTFMGGPGPDRLTGGGGRDDLEGEAGDDLLFARDMSRDKVLGGDGTDSARTDAVTVDAVSGIELLDATPAPTVHPPPRRDDVARLPHAGRAKVVRRHGHLVARVPLSCPAAATAGCRATLTLTAKHHRLGSRSVALRPGRRSTVSVRLHRVARRGRLVVHVHLSP
jgi:Ca2+-binding RTX toxin-like protein